MTSFPAGARVRILAPSFPRTTGSVTDPANGLSILTVTVRTHNDGRLWAFDPTDELELMTDDAEEPTGNDRAERAGSR